MGKKICIASRYFKNTDFETQRFGISDICHSDGGGKYELKVYNGRTGYTVLSDPSVTQ